MFKKTLLASIALSALCVSISASALASTTSKVNTGVTIVNSVTFDPTMPLHNINQDIGINHVNIDEFNDHSVQVTVMTNHHERYSLINDVVPQSHAGIKHNQPNADHSTFIGPGDYGANIAMRNQLNRHATTVFKERPTIG